MDSHSVLHPKIPVRNTDMLLAIFFGAMILLADEPAQRVPLVGLGIVQLLESRLPILSQRTGRVISVTLQLLLAFELMHESGGVASPYFPILLLPLVSTATYLGVVATVIASVAAVGALLSPLLFVDWSNLEMDPEGWHVLVIRGLLMATIAVLVNTLGKAIRTESARYKATAEELATANESLRAAEAAVRRAERLAALGQLTAGLAHELRNPLASIKGSADLLARRSASDPMSRELGEIISSEVDRTNLLVTRFLTFARPLEPQRETIDITEVIERAAGHANVEIIRDYSPDVPALDIDPALMEQVFINLLSNAAQASEPGTPVTVSTRRRAHGIEIDVIDRGAGISADKIETIFNPFFTTKQSGVGLGLAIVSKIVNGHGGKMTVDSEPGKGSTFRVCLPLESVSTPP
ncbi:MAG TPA: ATP-binding protein [Bryobacteraceae bacterium]|nr:ATP-binding protein [Bryobacteraceae bacterium]